MLWLLHCYSIREWETHAYRCVLDRTGYRLNRHHDFYLSDSDLSSSIFIRDRLALCTAAYIYQCSSSHLGLSTYICDISGACGLDRTRQTTFGSSFFFKKKCRKKTRHKRPSSHCISKFQLMWCSVGLWILIDLPDRWRKVSWNSQISLRVCGHANGGNWMRHCWWGG